MEPIRVLLAQMPRMLRDVFRQVVMAQPDMQTVGELDDPLELLLAVSETRADALVLGLHNSELPGICSHLLEEYPYLTILAVAAHGREAYLYGLKPSRTPVPEVSPQGLIDAIRSAVRGQNP